MALQAAQTSTLHMLSWQLSELLLLTALAAVLRLLSVRVVYVAETNQRPSPSPFGPSVRPMHSQSYNGYV